MSPSNVVMTHHHGPLSFVDCQQTFANVFGNQPTLLHITKRANLLAGDSIEDSNTVNSTLHSYFTKCKLTIFIHICRSDYVGSDFVADDSRSIQEITKQIQHYKMQYTVGSTIKTIRPNELYLHNLTLSSCLPKDSSRWNIVLCTTYFDALIDTLKDKMTDDNFTMPALTTLSSKHANLSALRSVKEAAAESYTTLLLEQKRFSSLLSSLPISSSNTNIYFHAPTSPTPTITQPTAQAFPFHSNSQAENTLSRYSQHPPHAPPSQPPSYPHISSSSHANPRSRIKAPCTTKPDGLLYPYDPQNPSNISSFPTSFRGCFGCGEVTHYRFSDCPHRSKPGVSTRFWSNLWLHKPHTKTKPGPIPLATPVPSTPMNPPNHYGPPSSTSHATIHHTGTNTTHSAPGRGKGS